MSIEELIAAAKESAREPVSSDDVSLFSKIIGNVNKEFEAEVRAQASEEVFMARTYTL